MWFNFPQGNEQLHFVLITGEPIKESVVQHGKFALQLPLEDNCVYTAHQ